MKKKSKLEEIDVTTASSESLYYYVCPNCNNGFNYPAKFTTSTPPFVHDGCPLCGHIFMEGLNEACPAK